MSGILLDHDSRERCDDCGREHRMVWMAPDELWAKLVPENGTLCPDCFAERASKQLGEGLPCISWWPRYDPIELWQGEESFL